jgi:hypothetical protein
VADLPARYPEMDFRVLPVTSNYWLRYQAGREIDKGTLDECFTLKAFAATPEELPEKVKWGG